jgi:hypothetical protein
MNEWKVRLWISHTNGNKLKKKYMYIHKAIIIIINNVIITIDKKNEYGAQVKADHMEERKKKKEKKCRII